MRNLQCSGYKKEGFHPITFPTSGRYVSAQESKLVSIIIRLPVAVVLFLCLSCESSELRTRRVEIALSRPFEDVMVRDLDGDRFEDMVFLMGRTVGVLPQTPASDYDIENLQRIPIPPETRLVWVGDVSSSAGQEIVFADPRGVFCFGRQGTSFSSEETCLLDLPNLFALDPAPARFAPFLCDLNNDGLEDILLPGKEGDPLIFYQRSGGRFDVIRSLPSMKRLNVSAKAVAWPAWGTYGPPSKHAAGLSIHPEQRLSLSLAFADCNRDNLLDVLITEPRTGAVRFWGQNRDGSFSEAPEIIWPPESKFSSDEVLVLDVNADGISDRVGITFYDPTEQGTLLLPNFSFSVDFGGQDTQTGASVFRSAFFPSQPFLIDLDTDGDLDLVTVTSPLRLGSREAVRSAVSEGSVELVVNCHFYRSQTGYQRKADVTFPLTVKVKHLSQISQSSILDLTGDLNGDGRKDLTALTEPGAVSVFLYNPKAGRFTSKPSARLKVSPDCLGLRLLDLDGDGSDDIIALDSNLEKITVFLVK